MEKARLSVMYKETVVPALKEQFGYKNVNEVPKLEKIVLNMGLGEVKDNSKSFAIASHRFWTRNVCLYL